MKNFLEILKHLRSGGVEFVIVGGVAARLYGSTRLTQDVDLVPQLTTTSWKNTIDIIWEMGGRPRIPETKEAISDLKNIKRWIARRII